MDLLSKIKYFQGAEDFIRDLGRSVHYFMGARESRPPYVPRGYLVQLQVLFLT